MITELNFAKLTPAAWAISNANNVDVGVGRSMLLDNIRRGMENNPMSPLPDEFTPDWAALKPQYDGLNDKAGVMSNSNVWHRICNEKYFELVDLWKAENYQGMADLVASTADPGPVGNGPARQEWEEAQHPEEPADE